MHWFSRIDTGWSPQWKADSCLEPAQKQKHLTQTFPDGQVYNSIYVFADNYIILCGHRDKSKRPTEYSCGTEKGGEFLIMLKRE